MTEPVVGRHFVVLRVVQNIVSVDSPSTCNPLMNAFVRNPFLRELILQVFLCGLLKVGLLAVNMIYDMFCAVIVVSTERSGCYHEVSGLLDSVAEHIY